MSELPKTTLTYLLNYIPNNDIEMMLYKKLDITVLSSYENDTNSRYFGGSFYLGGQIKMKPDEEITLQKINEVRQISKQRLIEYGGPSNSWEAISIERNKMLLDQMEEIIKFHVKLSYLNKLEQIELNNDVNLNILSFI